MKTPLLCGLVLFASFWIQVAAQQPLNQGLVAYYPFNGNANDASGNGNNATPAGSFEFLANGLSGGALRIIGDNALYYSGGGWVALPAFSSDLNSGFTVSFWVKDEVLGAYPIAHQESYFEMTTGIDNDRRVHFFLNQQRQELLYAIDGVGPPTDFYKSVSFPSYADSWKHLVLSYQPGRIAAFFNGEKVGEAVGTYDVFPVPYSALGRTWWDGGASSSARMSVTFDNVRIYNRALSDDDVSTLYRSEGLPLPDGSNTFGLMILAFGGLVVLHRKTSFC